MLKALGERVDTYVEFGVTDGTSLRAAFRAFASSANPGFHLIGFDFYSKDCRQKRCLKTAGYGGQVNLVVLRKGLSNIFVTPASQTNDIASSPVGLPTH